MDTQGHVSPEEIRAALKALYCGDAESNLQKSLLRVLADDLKPADDKGRWKPNRLLILLTLIVCAVAGIFVYFTLGAHS